MDKRCYRLHFSDWIFGSHFQKTNIRNLSTLNADVPEDMSLQAFSQILCYKSLRTTHKKHYYSSFISLSKQGYSQKKG